MINIAKDKRGTLTAIEFNQLPFKPKRVFLLHNFNCKESRGGHYHKKCKQYLFVISGKCNIILEYKKFGKTCLQSCIAGTSVNVPTYTKITIRKASKDCVICVLCNKKYDPKDAYYD